MHWFARLWALPVTLFGLLLAGVIRLSAGHLERHGIGLEASGGSASRVLLCLNPWLRIDAITLGEVIIARDRQTAQRMRSHEQVHVLQYGRWGILFPVAYAIASLIAVSRGDSAYHGNWFEREACRLAAR